MDATEGATKTAVITAQAGSDLVTDTIAIGSDPALRIRVPGDQFVKYGDEVRFHVSALDPAATLGTTDALPAGATFDPYSGDFHWVPGSTQAGIHEIHFTATGGSADSTAVVKVHVESGEPVITRVVNAATRSTKAACSPGAIASVEGRWLTDGSTGSDSSGASRELAGTKLLVNGSAASILTASATELTFLCPDAATGSELEVIAQTGHGITDFVRTTVRPAAPGIFSIDRTGGGQGIVMFDDGHTLAMIRNYRFDALPAMSGDRVTIYATGLDRLMNVQANLGNVQVVPDSVAVVPGHPGLFQVRITIPEETVWADALSLSLTGTTPEANTASTNFVSIAVEGATR